MQKNKKTLLILTDTTSDQVNGVTRSIDNLASQIPDDIELKIISADDFFSVPFLGYKEIRLSLSFPAQVYKKIAEIKPDFIHIETEGPIGLSAATACKKYKIPYTTSFHTKFPEYLNMRSRLIKEKYVHEYLHYIHDGAEKIFISNEGMIPYIERNNYGKYAVVPLGIDHTQFYPGERNLFLDENRIKLLFVGRIAIEKNIEKFLQISDSYAKYVVGDGPEKQNLQNLYPNTFFLGKRRGKILADIYRSVDIFVFPSLTDTLGLVNLEAMACGKPVVAYDIENMRGIITNNFNGILVDESASLEDGIEDALAIKSENCIATAKNFCWKNHTESFLENQILIDKKLWN